MKEIIKKYLEGCCQADPYFKEKYDESQLDKCCEFITNQAREMADGKHSIAIEDAVVFKWARDFYIEGQATIEAELARQKEAERLEHEAKAAEEARKRQIEERDKREHENGQITIFDLMGA